MKTGSSGRIGVYAVRAHKAFGYEPRYPWSAGQRFLGNRE